MSAIVKYFSCTLGCNSVGIFYAYTGGGFVLIGRRSQPSDLPGAFTVEVMNESQTWFTSQQPLRLRYDEPGSIGALKSSLLQVGEI